MIQISPYYKVTNFLDKVVVTSERRSPQGPTTEPVVSGHGLKFLVCCW